MDVHINGQPCTPPSAVLQARRVKAMYSPKLLSEARTHTTEQLVLRHQEPCLQAGRIKAPNSSNLLKYTHKHCVCSLAYRRMVHGRFKNAYLTIHKGFHKVHAQLTQCSKLNSSPKTYRCEQERKGVLSMSHHHALTTGSPFVNLC
eukprot:1150480-Pelagomonas_calceolata.AAC.3